MKRKCTNLSLLLGFVTAATILTITSGCKKEFKVSLPVLTTNVPTDVTSLSATCGGSVINEGGERTWYRGICWSTKHGPTIDPYLFIAPVLFWSGVSDLFVNYNVESGAGTFSFPMEGLSPLTKYYVRAFAENSAGIGYGNEVTFSTPR